MEGEALKRERVIRMIKMRFWVFNEKPLHALYQFKGLSY